MNEKNTPEINKIELPSRLYIALGWEYKTKNKHPYNLDIFAAAVDQNNYLLKRNLICMHSNRSILRGSIKISKDNEDGNKAGTDEYIIVDGLNLPENCYKVIIGVNIRNSEKFNQQFSDLSEAFLKIKDYTNGKVLIDYDLDELLNDSSAAVIGELYPENRSFKFNQVLSFYNTNTIRDIVKQYGVKNPLINLNL